MTNIDGYHEIFAHWLKINKNFRILNAWFEVSLNNIFNIEVDEKEFDIKLTKTKKFLRKYNTIKWEDVLESYKNVEKYIDENLRPLHYIGIKLMVYKETSKFAGLRHVDTVIYDKVYYKG